MTYATTVWADDIDIVEDLDSVKLQIFDPSARRSITLTEFTPEEAAQLAHQLLRAARGVSQDGKRS